MPLISRIRLAAIPAALSLVLAACGGGGSSSTSDAPASPCDTSPDFPRRPIELIVPWAAGGGTDSVARFIGTQLAERLDTQVNVVNRTGGSGAVGHTAIATARPDGTTIGLATVEITMMHWQGLTDVTYEQLTALLEGNAWKDDVRVAAPANVNLAAPGASIDGVAMNVGERFLAPNQTDPTQGGWYVWNGAAVAATRAGRRAAAQS